MKLKQVLISLTGVLYSTIAVVTQTRMQVAVASPPASASP